MYAKHIRHYKIKQYKETLNRYTPNQLITSCFDSIISKRSSEYLSVIRRHVENVIVSENSIVDVSTKNVFIEVIFRFFLKCYSMSYYQHMILKHVLHDQLLKFISEDI